MNFCSFYLVYFFCSWLVLRSQSLDPSYASQGTSKERESPELEQQEDCAVTSDWCSGADDWLR